MQRGITVNDGGDKQPELSQLALEDADRR